MCEKVEENKTRIYEMALQILERNEDILFVRDLIAALPIGKDSFYTYYPVGSDRFDNLKRLIGNNGVKVKKKLRKLWLDEETTSSSGQIFLYKLLADDDEKQAIYDTHIQKEPEPVKHNIKLTFEDENLVINKQSN